MYFVVLLNTLFCISHFTRSYFHFHDSSHGAWRARLHFTFQFSVHLSLWLSVSILTTSHLIFHSHLSLSHTCFQASVFSKEGLTFSFVWLCNGLLYEGVHLPVSLVIPSLIIMYFGVLLNTLFCISHFTRSYFHFHDLSHGAWRARLLFTFQFSVHLSLWLSVSIPTTSHLIFNSHLSPSHTCFQASGFSKEGLALEETPFGVSHTYLLISTFPCVQYSLRRISMNLVTSPGWLPLYLSLTD